MDTDKRDQLTHPNASTTIYSRDTKQGIYSKEMPLTTMPRSNADLTDQHIGPYHLLRLLEQGKLSEIYLAEHTEQRRQTAIKLLNERLIGDDLAKFFAQARML